MVRVIACVICSGRHHATVCPTATRYVEQCLTGTPDEYRITADIAGLVDLDAARRRLYDVSRRDTAGMAERSRRRQAAKRARDRRRETPHRRQA